MINGKRYCTVNTDASWDGGEAGLAVWIVMDSVDGSGPIRQTSNHKVQAQDNNVAEMMAFAHALEILIQANYTTDVLVWNTDSQVGMDTFMRPGSHPKYKTLGDLLQEAAAKIAPRAYAKKVKGHSKNSTSRNYINNQLDRMADSTRRKNR